MKLQYVVCLAAALQVPAAYGQFDKTQSGPFWRHMVIGVDAGPGCAATVNGAALPSSAPGVTFDGDVARNSQIHYHMDCSLGGASQTFDGTFTPNFPPEVPVAVDSNSGFCAGCFKLPPGAMTTTMAANTTFTPGATLSPNSTFEYRVVMSHGAANSSTPPSFGGVCDNQINDKTNQPKGVLTTNLNESCDDQTLGKTTVSPPHGFADGSDVAQIVTTLFLTAYEFPNGGGARAAGTIQIQVLSQYKMAPPKIMITPDHLNIAAKSGMTSGGSASLQISNVGGGLLNFAASYSHVIGITSSGNIDSGFVVVALKPESALNVGTGQTVTVNVQINTTGVVKDGTFSENIDYSPNSTGTLLVPLVIVTSGAVQPGDLTISYIQPVQVVHNFPPPNYTGPAGSEYKWQEMPFIAGKTTIVRVWIKNIAANAMPVNNVTAVLHGFATGVTARNSPDPLTPVTASITAQPYNGPLPLQSPPDYNEPTLDFYLPDDWVKADGAITIKVDIVPPSGFTDADLSNNSLTRTIALEKQPSGPDALIPGRLRVGWIPICQALPGGGAACPSNNLNNYWADIVKWFPVGDRGVDFIRADNAPHVYPSLVQSLTQYSQMLTTFLRPLKAQLEEDQLLEFDYLIGFIVDTTFPGILAAPTVVGACPDQTPPTPANPMPAVKNAPCLAGGLADAIFSGGLGGVALVTDYGSLSTDLADFSAANTAHELGHLIGLDHVVAHTVGQGNVGDGGCDDNSAALVTGCNNWPYPDPTIQFMGIDPTINGKRQPGGNYDFMSYCDRTNGGTLWISPYSFRRLFNNSLAPSGAFQDSWNSCVAGHAPIPNVRTDASLTGSLSLQVPRRVGGRDLNPPQDLAILAGTVQADGSGATLFPVFQINSTTTPSTSDPNGSYCLAFADSTGAGLGNFCFNLIFTDSELATQMPSAGFSFFVPLPAGTATIALTNQGSALATATAGAQPPTVSIQSPQPGDDWSNGLQTLSWSGTSTGSSPATYIVAYSTDGGTNWSPLSAPITDSQLVIDPGTLNGGSNLTFRVTVSDGVLNSIATVGPINITQAASGSLTPDPVDFRNGLLGVAVRRNAILTNNGSGPLHVTAVDFDSAAFKIVTPQPPFDVYPGAPATLKLTFSAPAAGLQQGHMTLTTNAANPTISVGLKGNGITTTASDAAVTPDHVDFGDAAFNMPVSQSVTLQSFGPAPLNVKSVAIAGTGFSMPTALGAFALAVNATQAIAVQFSPQHAGAHTGTLTIVSDDPVHGTITVPLTGNGTGGGYPPPPLTVSVASLDFGTVNLGNKNEMTVRVSSGASVNITAISSNPQFTVRPAAFGVGAGSFQDVTVRFTPNAAQAFTGKLTFSSPDNSASVDLKGTGAGSGAGGRSILVVPAGLDFGTVAAGQGKDLTVSVFNMDFNNALNITAVTSSNSAFSATPQSFSVGANLTFSTVTVHFAPTGAGSQAGTLTFASNDASVPSLKINVTGNATAAPLNVIRTLVHHEITSFPKQVRFGNVDPLLSASGNRIVYANAPGDETDARYNDIFVINPDGSGQRLVDSYKQNCDCGATVDISADGNTVVSTDGVELRIASATGSTGKRLITNREIPQVRIAPKGDKVFFVNRRGSASTTDPTTERGLYVINADGSGLKQIAGPTAVSKLFGYTPDQVFPFSSSGWSLDVSADGAKAVFGVSTPGGERVMSVSADGTGLKQVMGPFFSVNHVALSGDGAKVAYDVVAPPCCSTPNELGVINYDGSGRKALATNIGGLNTGSRMPISGDGSKVLYGNGSLLYSTDGSGVLQLSVMGGSFSGDPAMLINTGFLGSMNGTADRFVYPVADDKGIAQIATMDVNPATLGEAPAISAPTLSQPSIALSGANQSTVSAAVKTSDKVTRVSAGALNGGLYDTHVNVLVILDDGTHGDVTAGDGIYTSNQLGVDCCATLGPRTLRVKAEVRDSANRRHATAIEVGGLTVVSKAP